MSANKAEAIDAEYEQIGPGATATAPPVPKGTGPIRAKIERFPVDEDPAEPEVRARIRALVAADRAKGTAKDFSPVDYDLPIGKEWERLPRENDRAYAAWLLYRAMPGEKRSLAALAKQEGRSLSNYHRMSVRYHWQARMAAWEDYLERQVDTAERERLIAASLAIRDKQTRVVEEQLTAAKSLKFQALRVIQTQSERTDKQGGPDARALEMASRVLERATAMERLAVGLPTDVTQQTVALKNEVAESIAITERVKAIIQENLCADCKKRVTDELRRLSRRQRAINDRLSV